MIKASMINRLTGHHDILQIGKLGTNSTSSDSVFHMRQTHFTGKLHCKYCRLTLQVYNVMTEK